MAYISNKFEIMNYNNHDFPDQGQLQGWRLFLTAHLTIKGWLDIRDSFLLRIDNRNYRNSDYVEAKPAE